MNSITKTSPKRQPLTCDAVLDAMRDGATLTYYENEVLYELHQDGKYTRVPRKVVSGVRKQMEVAYVAKDGAFVEYRLIGGAK
jgi:hypothetical protein